MPLDLTESSWQVFSWINLYWLRYHLLNHRALWRLHFSKDMGMVLWPAQTSLKLSCPWARQPCTQPCCLPFCQCEHSSSHVVSWTGQPVHLEANPNRHTIQKKNLFIFTWLSSLIQPIQALTLAEGAEGLDGPCRVRMNGEWTAG